jgi:acyl-coenzyme A thioesterase PaaI-like protein
LGLVFCVDEAGVTHAIWQPSAVFQSYDERIHGGILATLMDASMVHTLFARGIVGVTVEITVRYHAPVLLGTPVEVTTRLEEQKHGVYSLRAEVRQDGDLAAKANAKFMQMPETEP